MPVPLRYLAQIAREAAKNADWYKPPMSPEFKARFDHEWDEAFKEKPTKTRENPNG